MPLNLALHELCTNVIKYGALSVAAGQVNVSWSVDGGQVRLLWEETGGPAVEAPQKPSFGTELIAKLTPYELNGRADLRFDPQGIRCELTFPLQSTPSPGTPDV